MLCSSITTRFFTYPGFVKGEKGEGPFLKNPTDIFGILIWSVANWSIVHKSKFWNIWLCWSLNKLFVKSQWAVTVSDFKKITQIFFYFSSLSLVSYRVINPLSQVPRVHSVQDLSVRKFAPWMFVEAKILVDRHLRFHCFRPLSSALHFLFFSKVAENIWDFAEVDKKSEKKNIFLLV